MKRVRVDEVGRPCLESVDIPNIGAGDALVEIAYAGVCGSDLHTVRHGHAWLDFPVFPGHEASGIVLAVGRDVKSVAVGDPVFLMPLLPCHLCRACRRGRTNLCERLRAVGSHIPGAMADVALLPESTLRRVPPGMSLKAAALVEPAATVIHAVRLGASHVSGTDEVAVIGGGTIGQLTALLLRSMGARPTVVDPSAPKRELALALGAQAVVADVGELGAHGALDYVFDCVAAPATIETALRQLSPGGSLVLIGAGRGAANLDIQAAQDGEITVMGSAMYVDEDVAAATEFVAGHDLDPVITSIRSLSEAPTVLGPGFDRSAEVKVLLRP